MEKSTKRYKYKIANKEVSMGADVLGHSGSGIVSGSAEGTEFALSEDSEQESVLEPAKMQGAAQELEACARCAKVQSLTSQVALQKKVNLTVSDAINLKQKEVELVRQEYESKLVSRDKAHQNALDVRDHNHNLERDTWGLRERELMAEIKKCRRSKWRRLCLAVSRCFDGMGR